MRFFRTFSIMWYKKSYAPIRKSSTIFALSTSSGMSAVAVVRVSGPNSKLVFYHMTGLKNLPAPRTAVLRKIRDPDTKEILDKGLILWFPSPNSFTGEDVCELQIHGGLAVKRTVLQALSKLPGFCHAEPGEFTKRAFIAGKLDLTEVEGLADLLHAETEAQQRIALRQMDGEMYKLYSNWSHDIKQSLAKVEAYIDFSEDQNLDNDMLNAVKNNIESLKQKMIYHVNDNHRGEKLRNGVHAVLIGKPNVGKSSLINALCKRDVAIVSSIPGTTRDIIEKSINLDGYLIHLSDTAGIRVGQDVIEEEGVKRTCKRLSEADILLFIVEAQTAMCVVKSLCSNSTNIIKKILEVELEQNIFFPHGSKLLDMKNDFLDSLISDRRLILIFNKVDLLSNTDMLVMNKVVEGNKNISAISCLSGKGLEEFLQTFTETVDALCAKPSGEEPTITQERHRKHVEICLKCLSEFEQNYQTDVVIAAENLRQAAHQLGRITGKITTEDILDIIFKDFCIGK